MFINILVEETDATHIFEVASVTTLEHVLEIMAGETGWSMDSLAFSHGGRMLADLKATLEETGVAENDLLILKRRVGSDASSSRPTTEDSLEKLRHHLLNDPMIRARTEAVHFLEAR